MVPKVVGSYAKRPVPKRGPISSDDYNDTFDDLISDLNQIFSSWNEFVQPLLDSLPSGDSPVTYEDRDAEINPFVNGFDGSQIYMDQTADTDVDDGYFFSTDLDRPLTIKETVQKVELDLLGKIDDLNNQIGLIDAATGLSSRIKDRIGANIFDEDETSASDSLDGLTQSQQNYILQLAADIFNEGKAAGDDPDYVFAGNTQTKTSTIMDLINSLEADVAGLGTDPIPQARVTDLVSDLLDIDDAIKLVRTGLIGATDNLTLGTIPFSGGLNFIGINDSLKTACESLDTDIDAALKVIREHLVGSSATLTDELVGWTPGLNYITAGNSLKTACEALDAAIPAEFTDDVTTTDATETLLYTSPVVPTDTEVHVEVKIMAVASDRSFADNWHAERQMYRVLGNLTVRDGLGILNSGGLTLCSVDIKVVPTTQTWGVYVTGLAGSNINWRCIGRTFTL